MSKMNVDGSEKIASIHLVPQDLKRNLPALWLMYEVIFHHLKPGSRTWNHVLNSEGSESALSAQCSVLSAQAPLSAQGSAMVVLVSVPNWHSKQFWKPCTEHERGLPYGIPQYTQLFLSLFGCKNIDGIRICSHESHVYFKVRFVQLSIQLDKSDFEMNM